jgi:DNA-directed RNA polymerase specialized sigma24 family protein
VKSGSVSAEYADTSEDVLVDRARTGDTLACEALIRRYNQRLYRVIRSVLKTGSDVEDTMQDTYLAALRNLHQFGGRAPFGTWLLKIGTNAALARMRQRIRVMQLDDLAYAPALHRARRLPPIAAAGRRASPRGRGDRY